MRITSVRLLLAAASILAAGCGGGDSTDSPNDPNDPNDPAPVATISVTPDHPTVLTDDHVTLAAVLKDSSGNTLTGRTVTWSSDKPEIATVSAAGEVTPVTYGDAVITAQSEGNPSPRRSPSAFGSPRCPRDG